MNQVVVHTEQPRSGQEGPARDQEGSRAGPAVQARSQDPAPVPGPGRHRDRGQAGQADQADQADRCPVPALRAGDSPRTTRGHHRRSDAVHRRAPAGAAESKCRRPRGWNGRCHASWSKTISKRVCRAGVPRQVIACTAGTTPSCGSPRCRASATRPVRCGRRLVRCAMATPPRRRCGSRPHWLGALQRRGPVPHRTAVWVCRLRPSTARRVRQRRSSPSGVSTTRAPGVKGA
jgi:hypothetical protein